MPRFDLGQLILRNSERSQNLGRRLYLLQFDGRKYWLKIQVLGVSELNEQYFENELEIYREINRFEEPDHPIISNFSILNPKDHYRVSEQVLPHALLIEDSHALFTENPYKISENTIIQILQKSLEVLENLHTIGFIHGDLKKEHFRIKNKKAYLIDFEQARKLQDLPTSNLSATPRYMAPELFHGQAKTVQTDIYALGIIWYEWLTQSRLSCNSYKEWAILHCQLLNINLPEKFHYLLTIFEQILAKKTAQRFANIYQIKQALSQNVQRKSKICDF